MPRPHLHHHNHDRHDYDYPAPAYSKDDHDNHSKWIYVRNQEEARKLDMQDGKIDGMHEGKMIAIAKVRPVPRPAAPRRALGPCGCPFCMEYRSGPRNSHCAYYEPGNSWTGYENEVVRPRPDLATFYYSDGRASGPVDARAYGQYAVGASDYVGRSADFYSEPYYGARVAPTYVQSAATTYAAPAATTYAARAAPTYVQSAASVAAPTYVQSAATYGEYAAPVYSQAATYSAPASYAAPASYSAATYGGYGAASIAAPTSYGTSAGYGAPSYSIPTTYAAPASYGAPAYGGYGAASIAAPTRYGTSVGYGATSYSTPTTYAAPASFGTLASGFPAGLSSTSVTPAPVAAAVPAPASTPAL